MTRAKTLKVAGMLIAVTVVTSAALAKRAVEPDPIAEAPALDSLVGLVQPGEVSTITAPAAITVAEVTVAPGDDLRAGDAVARIDDTVGQRELAQLKLALDRVTQDVADRERMVAWLDETIQRRIAGAVEAPSQLALAERDAEQVPMRQARDSPERAQLAYEQALLKERRLEQLAAAGLVPKQEVEDAHILVRLAADDVINARKAAAAAAGVRSAETGRARAQRELYLVDQKRQLAEQQGALEQRRFDVAAARMAYDAARAVVDDPYVRVPRDGAVLELLVHSGDRLTAGALLARVAPLDPVFVDVSVRPEIVNRIVPGDAALVDIHAARISGREARVRSIAPLPADDGTYAVRLVLPNPDRARLAGQTAYVRVVPGFSAKPPRP